MSRIGSKGLWAVLAVLMAGMVVLGGCAPAAAVYAQALGPATTGTPAAGTAAATAISPTAGATATPAATSKATGSTVAVDTSRTLTVVGHGEVKSKPNIATSSIGIEVLAPTVSAATTQAQTQMDAVLKALKAAGIADKDIQTSNFSINFERQQPTAAILPAPAPNASAPITGTVVNGVYRVSNMVNVAIRDLSKVSTVVDAAVNAGANNIFGINFSLDNTTTLESQAREKAVVDAKARAQSLAGLNGVSVGQVVAISEVIGQQPGPRYAVAQSAVGLGGGGTPVEPGEITFSTDIQVVYAIQ